MEHLVLDIKNIKDSFQRMGKYIRDKSIDSNPNNIKDLEGISKVVWKFLSFIHDSHWDSLYINNTNTTFRNKVSFKFTPWVPKNSNVNNKDKDMVKPTFISSIPPPILTKSQKEVNKLLKYFKKNTNLQQKKSCANTTSLTKPSSSPTPKNLIKKMLKIKETFLNLLNKKIKQVQKVINSSNNKSKLRITMTTKSPLRKQVIIPINNNITKKFIKDSSSHIVNINWALKAIKSSTIANFIQVEDKSIIIMTNNISSGSDLQEIEKYVKSSLSSNADKVLLAQLPQSKLYLKIVGIPFNSEKTNSCISLDEIKNVLKNNYLFNNIVLAFKPHVIKISPKSDMAIVWIDTWDTQNRSNAKKVINCWFNISSYITTVCSANMNPRVPQCKNC